ncbi:MAG: hypothetical protein ACRYG8_16700 [Janthinobacterium lividum]
MNIMETKEHTADQSDGTCCSDTYPTEAWVIQLKGDSDDCLITYKIIVGNQEAVADWIRTFLTSHMETMERLAGSPIEIKVRATTVDTVQGIASTADGMAYVQVRAMLFNVEVAA